MDEAGKPTPKLRSSSLSLEEEARSVIESLDKLYYEKPAGFFGYMALCLSSWPLRSFKSSEADEADDD